MNRNNNILFSITLIFISTFLFSQNITDSEEKDISEIIIEGKKQNDNIIPYQKLSGKELEKLNSVTVADAIRFFSGVQLKDYGGIGGMKTVNIRGMGSQHVGVFYDGIQLGNAQNGTVDLGKFSLDNLESISLYNGQKSQILQTAKDYSTAGSIYLKSKKPDFKINKKTNLIVSYRSGSFSLVNPSFIWEQKISPFISTSLSIDFLNSSGKYKFRQTMRTSGGAIAWDTTAIRKNGNINAIRAEAGIFGNIYRGKWNFKSYYYDSERGIPTAIVKNVYEKKQKQWDTNFFIQGSFEKEITDKYKLLLNSKFAYDYTHYLSNDESTKYINNIYKQKEFYFSLAQKYSLLPFWDLGLSADYQYNSLDANLYQFAYPERNTELVALASNIQLKRLKFQASVLGTFIQEKINNKLSTQASPDKNEFTPTLFLSYKPFIKSDFTLHGFYKRIFRAPTFNDLYYTEIGTSNLKPEYTTQYDFGINYSQDFSSSVVKNWGFSADIYYNEVRDKIIALAIQPFRWSMINLGETRIKGIEISTQASVLFQKEMLINLKAVYTYEDAQDVTSPKDSYYKNQIPYIPWNSGSLLAGLIFKKWDLNYSFIYTGERYNMSANIPDNYEKEWYTHDLSLSHTIQASHFKFKIAAEVNNIFDRQYYVIRNYPMPGRNYRLSLRINL
ncbi:TonB-dependent receptor [Apibacter raozihei]|uniref:TonB-dependent receptor n=1 Tax=Apibacter raozihei TaxID=2500547 RepID=UPI000FE2A627|nr:TonB-dependent receptor [Apibacter raozihei]